MLQSSLALDLVAALEASPDPYVILDAKLRFVAMNEAYLKATHKDHDDLLGRSVFDIFDPEQATDQQQLQLSLEEVLRSQKPHVLPIIFYPRLDRSSPRKNATVECYWQATHTPILDDEGQVTHILQQSRDVTPLVQLIKTLPAQPSACDDGVSEPLSPEAYLSTALIQAENLKLANERAQLLDMFMQAPGFVAIFSGPELKFQIINSACAELLGHRPVQNLPLEDALPEIASQGFRAIMEEVYTTGQAYQGRRTSVVLHNPRKNRLETRYLDFMFQPLREPNGQITGIFAQGHDVSDLVKADQMQKLMIDELNHRVKNTLATVQSIALQTARSHQDPASFAETFQARILALSHTHDLLTQSLWEGAELADVIRHEMAAYGGNRLKLKGPTIDLDPATAVSMGMIFHELATNAAKYGALTPGSGYVVVNWDLSGQGNQLNLTWCEEGGPKVTPPSRRGFGTRLIERNVRHDLSGRVETYFTDTGFKASFSIPLTKD